MASVTDSTVGMAMGIPPMSSTRRLLIPALYERCCIGNMTMISRTIPTAMEQMQKFPIDVRTYKKNMLCYCKLADCIVFHHFKRRTKNLLKMSSYICAVHQACCLPKKVLEPVAITTASISPCLQVEPEKT